MTPTGLPLTTVALPRSPVTGTVLDCAATWVRSMAPASNAELMKRILRLVLLEGVRSKSMYGRDEVHCEAKLARKLKVGRYLKNAYQG